MSKPTKKELSSLNESIFNVVNGNSEQVELNESIYKEMAKIERKMELIKRDLKKISDGQSPEKVVVLLARLFGTEADQKKAKKADRLGGVTSMDKRDKRNAAEILNKFSHIYYDPDLMYKLTGRPS